MEDKEICGVMSHWDEKRGFGYVRPDGYWQTLLVPRSQIAPDVVGRRYLVVGEAVAFDQGLSHGTKIAANVRPLKRPVIEDPANWRETCHFSRWNGSFGFADRAIGGNVLIHISEIVTDGATSIQIGDPVWCGFVPPKPTQYHKTWIGTDVHLYEAGNIRPELPALEIDADYREEGTVETWNGTNGFIKRSTGDKIFLHVRKIVTEGSVAVGCRVWYGIAPPKKLDSYQHWCAHDVHLFFSDAEIAEQERLAKERPLALALTAAGIGRESRA